MVVLAKARTHCPSEEFSGARRYSHLSPTRDHAAWVPAFARTTIRVFGERLSLDLGGAQLDGFAAAAGRDLVRVVEDELGLHLVGLVVHLGAEQEQHGL